MASAEHTKFCCKTKCALIGILERFYHIAYHFRLTLQNIYIVYMYIPFMDFDDAMYYGDIPVLHLEDEYLSSLNWIIAVVG